MKSLALFLALFCTTLAAEPKMPSQSWWMQGEDYHGTAHRKTCNPSGCF